MRFIILKLHDMAPSNSEFLVTPHWKLYMYNNNNNLFKWVNYFKKKDIQWNMFTYYQLKCLSEGTIKWIVEDQRTDKPS